MTTVGLSLDPQQTAAVSLTPETQELTLEERQRVNQQVGSTIDQRLPELVRAKFALNLDLAKLVALTGALKTSVRSKLQASLGTTKTLGAGTGAGGGAPAGVALGGAGGVQGGVTLGASLGLRGGGVAAGAEGTPLAGITLQSGTPPESIPGLTSGLTASLDAGALRIQVSAARELRADLDGLLGETLQGSGLSAEKQQAVKAEISPKIGEALEDSFRSSFGPQLSYPNAAGKRVLDAEIRMSRRGPWRAEVDIDELDEDAEPPTGPFHVEIDGIEYRGAVVPGRSGKSQSGRTRVLIVGGAGGLDHALEPRNYGGGVTRVKTVVDDIMRETGETLSAESDAALLQTQIAAWDRRPMTGRKALDAICDKVSADWRVLRDGTVWIGLDQWPEVEPDGIVEDDNWQKGTIALAPDVPALVPGVVVRGQRVEEVVHRVGPQGLRTDLRAQGVRSVLDKAFEPLRSEMDYTKRYRGKVTRENADGTVDFLIDDERHRGRGVARCAVHIGLPMTWVSVPEGSRALVGWRDGDASLPYVSDWERGAAGNSVSIGGENGRGIACIGDLVDAFLSPATPISGTVSGNPFVGTLTVLTPIKGIISSGRTKARAADG